ncbi:hypothetical protein KW783_00755 [Candidatus Parcubacteria bacterium]|nr:hypothetical protein [Candidatus Parcubacteria bacterium]
MPTLLKTTKLEGTFQYLVKRASNLELIANIWEGDTRGFELWPHEAGVMHHRVLEDQTDLGYFLNDDVKPLYKGPNLCLPFFESFFVVVPGKACFANGKRIPRLKPVGEFLPHPDGGITVINGDTFRYVSRSRLSAVKNLSKIPYDQYRLCTKGVATLKNRTFAFNDIPFYTHPTEWNYRWWYYRKRILFEKGNMLMFLGDDEHAIFTGAYDGEPLLFPDQDTIILKKGFDLVVIRNASNVSISQEILLTVPVEEVIQHRYGALTRWRQRYSLLAVK